MGMGKAVDRGGLPGRGSVAWRVNGERCLLLGWGRAVLLQLAHPLVAAGVDQHSGFRGSLPARLGRLSRTVEAMLSLTYGSYSEAMATAAHINEVHRQVTGRLEEATGPFPAGTPYSALDPELLLWVHATLVDTHLLMYRLLVETLSREERDRYCLEAAQVSTLLEVPWELLPLDSASLERYLEETLASGRIVVGETARRLARDLLAAPLPPMGWAPMGAFRLITAGLLPPSVREGYGFSWGPRRQRALEVLLAALRRAVALAPPSLRRWSVARSSGS